jgi:hypothetical protein
MARFKLVNGEQVPFTPEEEAARDAEELAWATRIIPSLDEVNQTVINKILAEPGSLVRAIAEVQFGMIKGQIPVTPTITKQQYIDLLKARML